MKGAKDRGRASKLETQFMEAIAAYLGHLKFKATVGHSRLGNTGSDHFSH